MDINEAIFIYWMVANCIEADCDGLMDCETYEYSVMDKQVDEAIALLRSAGLIDEEGELI